MTRRPASTPRKLSEAGGFSFYDDLRASLHKQPQLVERADDSEVLKVAINKNETMSHDTVRLIHVPFAMGLSAWGTDRQYVLSFLFPSPKGAMMAAHDFNTRSTAVVPDLDKLTDGCNVKLTVDIYDTESAPRVATSILSRHIHKSAFPYEAAAMVAASRSAVSVPLAILNSIRKLPQISHASAITDLDNRAIYPFFGRVIPSNEGDATAAMDFLSQHLKSTHCAIIYTDQEVGKNFRLSLERAAARKGISTRSVAVPYLLTEPAKVRFATAITQLLDTGYRHFVAVVFTSHLQELIEQGAPRGLFGPGKFWLMAQSARPVLGPYPRGSAMADAMQGIGFLTYRSPSSRHFDRLVQHYDALNENEEFMKYFESKTPLLSDSVKFTSNFSFAALGTPSHFVALAYDAVMALGISACNARSEFFNGQELMDEVTGLSFVGASGVLEIDPMTGSRSYNSSVFGLYNSVLSEPDEEGMVRMDGFMAAGYTSGLWESANGGFNYSDMTLEPPPSLPQLVVETSFARVPYIIFTVVGCLLMLISVVFAVWTWKYRSSYVVKASQPEFLLAICLGVGLMSASLTMVGSEHPAHSFAWANFSCMGSVWFFNTGFSLALSALFSKTWRVVKIMGPNVPKFRHIKVQPQDVALPAVLIVCGNLSLLLLWQLLDPLRFVRAADEDGSVDQYGRFTETIGSCSSEKDMSQYFLIFLFCLNLGVMIAANVQAYRARHITTMFSESRYIGLAMAIFLQAMVMSVPVLFFGLESGSWQLTGRLLIVISVSSILFLIFVPKVSIWRAHPGNEPPQSRNVFVSGVQQPSQSATAAFASNNRFFQTKKSRRFAVATPLDDDGGATTRPPVSRRFGFSSESGAGGSNLQDSTRTTADHDAPSSSGIGGDRVVGEGREGDNSGSTVENEDCGIDEDPLFVDNAVGGGDERETAQCRSAHASPRNSLATAPIESKISEPTEEIILEGSCRSELSEVLDDEES